MISLLASFLVFSIGFAAGSFFRGVMFENQHWMVMKWSSDSLGFRPVMVGSKVFRKDKIAMALEVDTSAFPEDGLTVE